MSIKHYHTLYQYLIIVFGVMLLQIILFSFSQGEITLDGILGERGSLVGPHYGISANMGRQEGKNLFHSFGQFTLNSYESATFTGPSMVENIIGRVTGGTASWIDGILRSNIQGANLYLLNPSGIIFGPNACLDLTGSFHVSTSDYINLGHSGRFDATQTNNSLLTADSPSAFGFLGDNPSDISIQGSFLQVPDGETISLVGGNLELNEGSVFLSPNGRINIVSVESAGEAVFTCGGVEVDSHHLGDISVWGDSYISSSGEGGGAVFIRGGRFVLDHSYIWADTWGDIDGGAIDIYLEKDLVVTGGISASTYEAGCGGDIILKVKGLDIIDGGVIEASTFGIGQSGDLKITVKDSLLIFGPGSKICSLVSDSGNAGNIDLTAQTLTITEEGMISGATNGEGRGADIILKVESLELTNGGMIDTSAFAAGQGGEVMVLATNSVFISNQAGKQDDDDHITGITSISSGTSRSGSIKILTPNLAVANDGLIIADTHGEGDGGEIELKVGDLSLATGSVFISGTNAALSSCAFREGDGGLISLSSPILVVSDGGGIEAATLDEGKAGEIILRVSNLTLSDKGYITTNSFGTGDGGKLTVSATEAVSIFGQKNDGFGSGLFSEASSGGAAGSISLKTSVLKMTDRGQINASTLAEGVGGDIEVEADQIYLSNEARIEAASRGNGDAGDIVINAGDMIYSDHASVATEAIKADGGNIRIDTQNLSYLTDSDRRIGIISEVFFTTPNSLVSASSRLGIDGTVEIFSPMVDVSSGLVFLPESFLKADDLLPKRCAEKDDDEASSFHIIGHEGAPPGPDSLLY